MLSYLILFAYHSISPCNNRRLKSFQVDVDCSSKMDSKVNDKIQMIDYLQKIISDSKRIKSEISNNKVG